MSEVETPADSKGKSVKGEEEVKDNVVDINENSEALTEEPEGLQEPEVVEEEKNDDFKEKFYYLAAELENSKKRFGREKENLIKYGNEKILTSLLEVVDNLDRTITSLSEDSDAKVKKIISGVDMVKKQFLTVLKQNGLEEIKTKGKQFDPNFHEAMSQQSAEGKKDGDILIEYQKGYILNGRLLRASKVVVVKN